MLLGRAKGSDIVMLESNINGQISRISSTENQVGEQFALKSRRNDNEDRLLHICASC